MTTPIPISRLAHRYYIYNIDHAMFIRENHNMAGMLAGTLPQHPQQSIFLGLPVELMAEEARLLVEKGVAYIVDDVVFHKQGVPRLSREHRELYIQDLRQQGMAIQKEALQRKNEEKEEALAKMSETKKAKAKAVKAARGKEESAKEDDPTSVENANHESLLSNGHDHASIASAEWSTKNLDQTELPPNPITPTLSVPPLAPADLPDRKLPQTELSKRATSALSSPSSASSSRSSSPSRPLSPQGTVSDFTSFSPFSYDETDTTNRKRDKTHKKKEKESSSPKDAVAPHYEKHPKSTQPHRTNNHPTEEPPPPYTHTHTLQNTNKPPHITADQIIVPSPSSYALYSHLHKNRYFLLPGLRFGAQYNVYPGDPLRFHAHFLARSYEWEQSIDLLHIVGGGRLGTGVKKAFLIGGRAPDKKGVEKGGSVGDVACRDSEEGKDADVRLGLEGYAPENESSTIENPDEGVRCFCVEWSGM